MLLKELLVKNYYVPIFKLNVIINYSSLLTNEKISSENMSCINH